MRISHLKITYSFEDALMRSSALYTGITGEMAAYTDTSQFFGERTAYRDYCLMGHNTSFLDGTLDFPSNTQTNEAYGLQFARTNAQGDNNGTMSIYMADRESEEFYGLTLTMTKTLPSQIICRYIDDDYPNGETITFNLTKDDIIGVRDDFYEIWLSWEGKNVTDITLTFVSDYPNAYPHLVDIHYGRLFEWGSEDVTSCTVHQECDLLSQTTPSSTATFKLKQKNSSFHLGGRTGFSNFISKKNTVKIEGYVKNDDDLTQCVLRQLLYIDKVTVTADLPTISCIDAFGAVSNAQYSGSRYFYHADPRLAIDDIMETCGFGLYKVVLPQDYPTITGIIKAQSCKQALSEVLNATGLIATYDIQQDDGGYLVIKAPEYDYRDDCIMNDGNTFSRNFSESTKNGYDGVEITYTYWWDDNNLKQFFDTKTQKVSGGYYYVPRSDSEDTYYEIKLNSPGFDFIIDDCVLSSEVDIDEERPYSVDIRFLPEISGADPEDYTFKLKGKSYESAQNTIYVRDDGKETPSPLSPIKIKSALLDSSEVAKRIDTVWNIVMGKEAQFKGLPYGKVACGRAVKIERSASGWIWYGDYAMFIPQSIDIDLYGGMTYSMKGYWYEGV